MAQNRSSAVMQQRAEPHDSLDYFPTPPWATRALCEWLVGQGHALHLCVGWDPACGEGHMSRPSAEYFDRVHASDVHHYGDAFPPDATVSDFLLDWGAPAVDADWIITNPPFRLAQDFIRQAMIRAREGCAILVRSAFLEGQDRHASLFAVHPPAAILQFAERVVMAKGRLLNPNLAVPVIDKATGETVMKKPSTATAYSWIVWRKAPANITRFDWIAPCRARLERASDYPATPLTPLPLEDLT